MFTMSLSKINKKRKKKKFIKTRAPEATSNFIFFSNNYMTLGKVNKKVKVTVLYSNVKQ